MSLREFLDHILQDDAPYTVAAEHGQGRLFYAENGSKEMRPEEDLLDRDITEVCLRDAREEVHMNGCVHACALKAGAAIIIEGYENGSI